MTSDMRFRLISLLLAVTAAGALAACAARSTSPPAPSIPTDAGQPGNLPTSPPTEIATAGYYVSGWT